MVESANGPVCAIISESDLRMLEDAVDNIKKEDDENAAS